MVLIINFSIYRSYLKVFEKLVLRTSFSFSVAITKKNTFRSNFSPTKSVQIRQINQAKQMWTAGGGGGGEGVGGGGQAGAPSPQLLTQC